MVDSKTTLATGVTGSTDYKFVVVRSDDGKATIELQHLTTQANGSQDWETANDAKGNPVIGKAGWDDAIPWQAGTYDLTYAGPFAGGQNSWRVLDNDSNTRSVSQRDGIRLHLGNQTTPSQPLEGCIGATAVFLAQAKQVLSAAGEIASTNRIPMEVNDDSGSYFPLGVTETISKKDLDPGEVATITLSWNGQGTANGLSKNAFFHIGAITNGTGSTASLGKDYSITAVGGKGEAAYKPAGSHAGATWPAGEYLEIPAGQNTVTYTVTSNYKDPDNNPKTADLTIDNYYVDRNYNGKITHYSDHIAKPKIIIQNSSISSSIVTLNGKSELPKHLSGGIAGLHRTFDVVAGDTINFDFQAYTIPDSLSISDGSGSSYGTGGFVSNDHQGSFIAQSGKINVDVIGSDDGTAWDLDLTETPAVTPSPTLAKANTLLATTGSPVLAQKIASRSLAAVAMAMVASPSSASTNDATISLVDSWNVTVSPSADTTPVSSAVVDGHSYLARIVDQNERPVFNNTISVADQGEAPFVVEGESNFEGETATSFKIDGSKNIDIIAHGDDSSTSADAKIELFDVTNLASPLLYLENDVTDNQNLGSDQGVAIHVHRIGDLSTSATYNLLVKPNGADPLQATDVGGSLSIPVTFDVGEDIATATIDTSNAAAFAGTRTASVVIDPTSVSAETAANDQVLGLTSSLDISISSQAPDANSDTPVIDGAAAQANSTDGTITFTFTLSTASSNEVYAAYATTDDTARSGVEYQGQNGIVTFAAGQTQASVTIQLQPGQPTGADKSFNLALSTPFNATLAGGGSLLTESGTIHEVGDPTSTVITPISPPVTTPTNPPTTDPSAPVTSPPPGGNPVLPVTPGSPIPDGGQPVSGSPVHKTSFDPTPIFRGHGTFLITGQVDNPAQVQGIELFSNGIDLGSAAIDGNGVFSFFDKIGASSQTFFSAVTTDVNGQTSTQGADFSLQGGLSYGKFVARADSYSADGEQLTSTSYFKRDGSRSVDVESSGQTLTSNFFDTFQNHGAPNNNFVFDPGHGLDIVKQFRVSGTDHDTLSFLGSDYGTDPASQLAALLQNASNGPGGVTITDPTSGDTVKLTGITKHQLVANQGDFSFHA